VFSRLGRWSYRRRGAVIGIWVATLVLSGMLLGSLGGPDHRTEFTLPDVESRDGIDIFEDHFGGAGAGMSAPIAFTADQGVDDPEVQAAMEELLAFVSGNALSWTPDERAYWSRLVDRLSTATTGLMLSAPEIFRFGLWMTLVAYLVVLTVALPYWSAVGEPLVLSVAE
jgi:hypothetical protein